MAAAAEKLRMKAGRRHLPGENVEAKMAKSSAASIACAAAAKIISL
jgi:hypothetical protein